MEGNLLVSQTRWRRCPENESETELAEVENIETTYLQYQWCLPKTKKDIS